MNFSLTDGPWVHRRRSLPPAGSRTMASLRPLAEALVQQILQTSRPGVEKLSMSTEAQLRAAGGALQVHHQAKSVSWSESFLLSLPAFHSLEEEMARRFLASELKMMTQAPQLRARELLIQLLSAATLAEGERSVTLYGEELFLKLEHWCQALQTREAEFTLHRRLLGVDLQVLQLALSDSVELVWLSDEDLTQRMPPLEWLKLGLITPDMTPIHRAEVRVRRLEKLERVDEYRQGPPQLKPYLRQSERVLEGLLLFRPEAQVELGTPFLAVSQPPLGRCPGARLPQAFGSAVHVPIVLRGTDGGGLQRCFQVAQQSQRYPNLRSALHRYVLAGSRARCEDRLVDLVIGFESILLQGLQNELSHRFSLNGSSLCHWIHRTPRRESYRLFRGAYAARSALVHGYGSKLGRAQLESLSVELRHLLADFIQWLVLEAPGHGLSPRLQADDWLTLLFEAPPKRLAGDGAESSGP